MIRIPQIARQTTTLPSNSIAINQVTDVANVLRKLEFDQRYFSVRYSPAGMFVSSRRTEFPVDFPYGSRWPWGIGWTDNTVSIYNAILNLGTSWAYNAGPLTLQIPVDDYWLGYEYDMNAATFALITSSIIPKPNSGKVAGPLYRLHTIQGNIDSFTIDLAHGLGPTNVYS